MKGAMILKKMFKYDYSNKKRNFCIAYLTFGVVIFIFLNLMSFGFKSLIILPFVILMIFSIIHYSKKGIFVNSDNNTIIIRDQNGKHSFSVDKIKKVSIVEIDKINKGIKNLIFLFVLGAKEEIETWDYVYNNGRVFNIVFKVKDENGGYFVYKSYFGWMYKERSLEKVDKIVKKLENFIEEINNNCNKKINQ